MTAKKLLVASMLPMAALVACSTSTSTETTTGPTPNPSVEPVDGSDDPGEANGGTRIPLGQTKVVLMPADAVLDIKGLPDWDKSALRCTATTASGQALELLPPDPTTPPEAAAHGGTWVPLWTVAAAPGEVTIGCTDPETKIPNSSTSFVRVVPRGIMFAR